ncbi:GTP binding protein [Dinochytrium kinnereticum]|nr:GTP binding protein [Dinochytrium kinnereticum]
MDLGANSSYESSFMVENVRGNALPQEVEEGNVEYKLKLVNPPPERVEHLITQLKWRLAEGHGEAMYEIGVADNGQLVGLNARDLDASLATLRVMGSRLSADVSIIRKREVAGCVGKDGSAEMRVVAEVLVRKCLTDDQHFLEVRVAILGGADAGKSTLVGVLTHSEFDNGRGKSRLNLLRHRHEIETGRTSSISHQIIGFNPQGDMINYGTTNIGTWEQVCETASKVVTFLDTCGHPKYQRTTISGISGHSPDYACLILGASAGGISEVPREHLGIAVGLTVPVFVVITKIDVATQEQLTRTVSSLLGLLKSPGVRRVPMVIQNEDDLVVAVSSLVSSRVIPIFLTSSVTGENMDLLIKFLNLLPKPLEDDTDRTDDDDVEFAVEEVYSVPSIGTVLGGILQSGQIHLHRLGSSTPSPLYYLGPDRGRFIPVKITSLQRQRCPVNRVGRGQAATCAVSFVVGKRSRFGANGEEIGSGDVAVSGRVVGFGDGEGVEDEEDEGEMIESPYPPLWFRVRKGQVLLSSPPWRKALDETTTSPIPIPDRHDATGLGDSTSTAAAKFFSQPLLTASGSKTSVWEFEADLNILHATSSMGVGSQGVTYCGAVGQGCRVVSIRDDDGKWAYLPPSTGSNPFGSSLPLGSWGHSPISPSRIRGSVSPRSIGSPMVSPAKVSPLPTTSEKQPPKQPTPRANASVKCPPTPSDDDLFCGAFVLLSTGSDAEGTSGEDCSSPDVTASNPRTPKTDTAPSTSSVRRKRGGVGNKWKGGGNVEPTGVAKGGSERKKSISPKKLIVFGEDDEEEESNEEICEVANGVDGLSKVERWMSSMRRTPSPPPPNATPTPEYLNVDTEAGECLWGRSEADEKGMAATRHRKEMRKKSSPSRSSPLIDSGSMVSARNGVWPERGGGNKQKKKEKRGGGDTKVHKEDLASPITLNGGEDEEDDDDCGLWGRSEADERSMAANRLAKERRKIRMLNHKASMPPMALNSSQEADEDTELWGRSEADKRSIAANRVAKQRRKRGNDLLTSPIPMNSGKEDGEDNRLGRSELEDRGALLASERHKSRTGQQPEWTPGSSPSVAIPPRRGVAEDVVVSMSPLTLGAVFEGPVMSFQATTAVRQKEAILTPSPASRESLNLQASRSPPRRSGGKQTGATSPRSIKNLTTSRSPKISFSTAEEPSSTAKTPSPNTIDSAAPRSPTTPSRRRSRTPSVIYGQLDNNNGITPLVHPITLATGKNARVRLRFEYEPEWMKVGAPVLFRGEGRMKCVGRVVGLVCGEGVGSSVDEADGGGVGGR